MKEQAERRRRGGFHQEAPPPPASSNPDASLNIVIATKVSQQLLFREPALLSTRIEIAASHSLLTGRDGKADSTDDAFKGTGQCTLTHSLRPAQRQTGQVSSNIPVPLSAFMSKSRPPSSVKPPQPADARRTPGDSSRTGVGLCCEQHKSTGGRDYWDTCAAHGIHSALPSN